MPLVNKKRGLFFLLFLNIILVIIILLACLVPYLKAGEFWPIAIAGMGFPILLILAAAFMIVWLLNRSGRFLISLIAILLSWQQISVTFGINAAADTTVDKLRGALRIMSWNVSSWDDYNIHTNKGPSCRNDMIKLVQQQNADMVCFQEFLEPNDPNKIESNIPALQKMGFEYHYFFPTIDIYNGYYKIGVAIFSKYPITDSAHVSFNADSALESLLYADITVKNQKLRLITTHLQSVHFDQAIYRDLKKVKKPAEGPLLAVKIFLSKIKTAYQYRSAQAEQVRAQVSASPYPVIVCGDLNDVPNSYTYFTIRQNLRDAFLKKGFGIGNTFRFLFPTLRIDYILADKKFEILQYKRFKVPYSDHYPILADLRFRDGF